MFRFLNFLVILLTFTFTFFETKAQTGPGGVQQTNGSSELVMWLDANKLGLSNGAEVTSWTDLSGYGNNASSISGNRPTFNSSWTNGMPSVNFTSSNQDYLYVSNSSSTQFSQHTIYVIADMSEDSDEWSPLLVKSDDYDWGNGYGVVRSSTDEELIAFDDDYSSYSVYSSITYDTPFMVNHWYNGSKIKFYKSGANQGTTNYSYGIYNSTEPLYIGVSPYYSGSLTDYLDGNIAEIIIFDDNLKNIERILVDNYLSSKYNISTTNDRYAYESTHKHEVFGIGRKNSSSNSVTTAQGQGIVEISSPSALANNEYLLVGHDNNALTAYYTDAPNEFTYRLNRSWRVDETGDVGTVSISFDVTGLGLPTDANEYALLIDTDGDFSNATVHTTGASYSSNTISFTGVDFSDGNYFTLAPYRAVTWNGSSFAYGSGAASAPNSSDSDRKFYVYGSGGSLTSDASVRNMVVTGAGAITLSSNATITVSNEITNNGTVTVESGAGIVQTHSSADANSGSGTYNIKRVGLSSVNGYNGISSPIQSASISSTFPSNNPCDIFMFDGDLQLWKYDYTSGYTTTCQGNSVTFGSTDVVTGGDGNMNVATGYYVPGYTTPTKTFSGTINNGQITKAVYKEVNPNNVNWTGDDWNLVGNPYPSAINATSFWNENAINNSRITNAIYFWEDDVSSGSGYNQYDDYASWNASGGTSSSNSAEVPNGYISSCQGFWVIANASTNIVFNNSMRGGTNTQFFKQANQDSRSRFWFSVESSSGDYNQMLLSFDNNTTLGVDDAYDAIKYVGNPDMYMGSVINNETYVIQGRPHLQMDETTEIPLELFSNTKGLHFFKLDSIENKNNEYKMVLLDKLHDKEYDITNGVATIFLKTKGKYSNRFYLSATRKKQKDDTSTSVKEAVSSDKIFAYQLDNNIYVNLVNSSSKAKRISLMTIDGKAITTKTVNGSKVEKIGVDNLSNGVYLLSIEHQSNQRSIKKIIIQK